MGHASVDHQRPLQRRNRRAGFRNCAATGSHRKSEFITRRYMETRTKPGMFEGIGAKGLPWAAKSEAGYRAAHAVEVATGKQVQDTLTFDVDVLWIGAVLL